VDNRVSVVVDYTEIHNKVSSYVVDYNKVYFVDYNNPKNYYYFDY
jgi:hypothetical protein